MRSIACTLATIAAVAGSAPVWAASEPQAGQATASISTSKAASLTQIKGKVLVSRGQGFVPVQPTAEIRPGDYIMVEAGGSAQVQFASGCFVPVKPGNLFTVPSPEACQVRKIETGSIRQAAQYVGGPSEPGTPSETSSGTPPANPAANAGAFGLTPVQIGLGALAVGGAAAGIAVAANSGSSNSDAVTTTTPPTAPALTPTLTPNITPTSPASP